MRLYPSVLVFSLQTDLYILAIGFMNRYAVATSDKAHNIVAGKRITALCVFYCTVFYSVKHNAVLLRSLVVVGDSLFYVDRLCLNSV